LKSIKFKDVTPMPMDLPPRKIVDNYVRPPMDEQTFVEEVY
jgi:hypothetical protein